MRTFRLRPNGRIAVRLTAREHALLSSLPDRISALVTEEHEDSPVRARLFPPAYDEPELEQEYRGLMGGDLLEGRLEALRTFAGTLANGTIKRGQWQTELSPEDAHAWLSTTNDARLALGVVAGITTEAQWEQPHNDDPTRMTLLYLGWLQEQLLAVLMGTVETGQSAADE